MLSKITIAGLLVTACTVGEDTRPTSVVAYEGSDVGSGSDAGTCPTGDCDPYSLPATTDDGGGGSGSGSAIYAGFCATPPALPAGCVVYRGSTANAQWLNCYFQNGSRTPVGCATAGGFAASCELSDLDIAVIAADCNSRSSSADKILCANDGIRSAIGGGWGTNGNVCRHFARCFKKVYEAMGYEQSVTTKWSSLFFGDGHTFNLVPTTGGGQYVVDTSNDIMFWCP